MEEKEKKETSFIKNQMHKNLQINEKILKNII